MGLRVTPGEGQRSSKSIRKEKRRLGSSRPNPPQPAARSYSHLVLASADAEGQPGDNRTWGWNGWLHFYLLKRGQQSETHFGFFFFNKSTSHCFSYLPISTTPTSRFRPRTRLRDLLDAKIPWATQRPGFSGAEGHLAS